MKKYKRETLYIKTFDNLEMIKYLKKKKKTTSLY